MNIHARAYTRRKVFLNELPRSTWPALDKVGSEIKDAAYMILAHMEGWYLRVAELISQSAGQCEGFFQLVGVRRDANFFVFLSIGFQQLLRIPLARFCTVGQEDELVGLDAGQNLRQIESRLVDVDELRSIILVQIVADQIEQFFIRTQVEFFTGVHQVHADGVWHESFNKTLNKVNRKFLIGKINSKSRVRSTGGLFRLTPFGSINGIHGH